MGRSVDYPSNSEFTVFLTFDYDDPDDASFEWDWFVGHLSDMLVTAFPALTPCDTWDGNECRGFLENTFGKFFVSEYCGRVSLSFKLDDLAENTYYGGNDITGLGVNWASRAYNTIVERFQDLLYRKIGSFSNGECVYERLKGN